MDPEVAGSIPANGTTGNFSKSSILMWNFSLSDLVPAPFWLSVILIVLLRHGKATRRASFVRFLQRRGDRFHYYRQVANKRPMRQLRHAAGHHLLSLAKQFPAGPRVLHRRHPASRRSPCDQNLDRAAKQTESKLAGPAPAEGGLVGARFGGSTIPMSKSRWVSPIGARAWISPSRS